MKINKEKRRFLRQELKEYGIDQDGAMTPEPPTYEELKEKANRLYRTYSLYWEFLAANGLREGSIRLRTRTHRRGMSV